MVFSLQTPSPLLIVVPPTTQVLLTGMVAVGTELGTELGTVVIVKTGVTAGVEVKLGEIAGYTKTLVEGLGKI